MGKDSPIYTEISKKRILTDEFHFKLKLKMSSKEMLIVMWNKSDEAEIIFQCTLSVIAFTINQYVIVIIVIIPIIVNETVWELLTKAKLSLSGLSSKKWTIDYLVIFSKNKRERCCS